MITTKELSFVKSKADRVPYPGINYAEKTAEKLIKAVEDYDKFYANKEYDLILSNGEQILFEILSMNLCHMLGVDFKTLLNEQYTPFREEILGLTGNIKSYDFIKSMVNNIEQVLKYDNEHEQKLLNYYRIMIKCSIFEKLSNFSMFNFGVINFDKDTYRISSSSYFSGKSDKFLYVQSNEAAAPYFMMGILPNGNTTDPEYNPNKYAVETLIAPDNTCDFFKNQEVVIPTQILITTTNNMDKLEATPSEKLALLNQYKSIINNYGLKNRLNIYGDYESVLASSSIEGHKTKTRTL